ncbi:hypothetical protein GCM10009804_48010 [Kribbella hippodromi]|uniref:Twin-arginine translocation signal domain-containing protein n=1 Tax=Kribbella hippodromi TaxID=434347 RepID=A0ABN2DTQ1_9ACTN
MKPARGVRRTSADGTTRRRFLGGVSKVGMAVVAGAAGLVETGQKAMASPQATWRCCNLYFGQPNCPINSSGSYYCTRGTMRQWCCCSGSRTYACGECTGGSSCGQGPFYCSAGWTTAPNTCVSGCASGVATADAAELATWNNGTYPSAPAPDYVDAHPEVFAVRHR